MGLFGDFFDDPLFDLDGNGEVDPLEELLAFDCIFDDSSADDDIFDDFD